MFLFSDITSKDRKNSIFFYFFGTRPPRGGIIVFMEMN